jgi:hypothetical protein
MKRIKLLQRTSTLIEPPILLMTLPSIHASSPFLSRTHTRAPPSISTTYFFVFVTRVQACLPLWATDAAGFPILCKALNSAEAAQQELSFGTLIFASISSDLSCNGRVQPCEQALQE